MNSPRNQENHEFEYLKENFWHNYVCQIIPQDLHENYRDTLNHLRRGFEKGVEFVLEFQEKKN